MTTFAEAYKLPIGEHVEKKGKFSYLSWPYAVRFLRENFPAAIWIIHENAEGLPIFSIGSSHMVKVSVILDGQTYTQWHPVLNSNNKPIPEPSTFEINTSIQRALAKAIGIATGIGLGLYAGEDLPTEEGDGKPETKKPQTLGNNVNLETLKSWMDKYHEAADAKGFTSDTLETWYNQKPEVVALKGKLDAEALSAANRHFIQIKSAMLDGAAEKAA